MHHLVDEKRTSSFGHKIPNKVLISLEWWGQQEVLQGLCRSVCVWVKRRLRRQWPTHNNDWVPPTETQSMLWRLRPVVREIQCCCHLQEFSNLEGKQCICSEWERRHLNGRNQDCIYIGGGGGSNLYFPCHILTRSACPAELHIAYPPPTVTQLLWRTWGRLESNVFQQNEGFPWWFNLSFRWERGVKGA